MSAYDDINEGLDEIRRSAFVSGTTKKSYKQASPKEAPRVFGYLDGGAEPSPFPTTLMGSGLTKVERGRRALVPPPPPPPDPVWVSPLRITSGGVYSGNWEATQPGQAAIVVATTQPVTITGRVRNLTGQGGALIDCIPGGAVDVTVENLHAYGKLMVPNNESPQRFLWTENHHSLVVRNCTIEYTGGIEVNGGQASGSVLITRNRHLNIQGYVDNAQGILQVGNFVQFRQCTSGTIEVSWNEVLNEYGKSWPEDIISLYHTSGAWVHDNYLQHQSTPGNAPKTSSQGGITVDASDGVPAIFDSLVERNQVVDGFAITLWPGPGGSNNRLLDNRIVADRYLPNGDVKGNGWGAGVFIQTGGSNNHAHGNVVGYVSDDGSRVPLASQLLGAAEGGAAEAANNTSLPDPITAATEQAEWTLWQQKLMANGITVGA